jgi:uncharacterized protein YjbJ (UPF0337 family)
VDGIDIQAWRRQMWNTEERNGKIRQAKGKIKQVVGGLIHDDALKSEGQRDEVVGSAEQTIGEVRRTASGAIEHIKKAVK